MCGLHFELLLLFLGIKAQQLIFCKVELHVHRQENLWLNPAWFKHFFFGLKPSVEEPGLELRTEVSRETINNAQCSMHTFSLDMHFKLKTIIIVFIIIIVIIIIL